MIGGGPESSSIPWGAPGIVPLEVYAKGGQPPRAPTHMVDPSPYWRWRRPDGRPYMHDPDSKRARGGQFEFDIDLFCKVRVSEKVTNNVAFDVSVVIRSKRWISNSN